MVKRTVPDKINLDEIMKESMKEMGKGEATGPNEIEKKVVDKPQPEQTKPQFGFKLGQVKTPDSFVVAPKEKKPKQEVKQQVILERPSQGLDDDIVVDW